LTKRSNCCCCRWCCCYRYCCWVVISKNQRSHIKGVALTRSKAVLNRATGKLAFYTGQLDTHGSRKTPKAFRFDDRCAWRCFCFGFSCSLFRSSTWLLWFLFLFSSKWAFLWGIAGWWIWYMCEHMMQSGSLRNRERKAPSPTIAIA